MNTFDPDAFMNETVDKPLSTERTLVPKAEYKMTIGDFDSKAFQAIDFTYKQGDRAGTPGQMVKFGVPCIIVDDAKLKEALGLEKVVVFKNITLDFDENGKLAWGPNKNVDLGQLRNAVGQNADNATWSPGMLRGAGPFMGIVEHKKGERKDGSKFELAEVGRVAPIR